MGTYYRFLLRKLFPQIDEHGLFLNLQISHIQVLIRILGSVVKWPFKMTSLIYVEWRTLRVGFWRFPLLRGVLFKRHRLSFCRNSLVRSRSVFFIFSECQEWNYWRAFNEDRAWIMQQWSYELVLFLTYLLSHYLRQALLNMVDLLVPFFEVGSVSKREFVEGLLLLYLMSSNLTRRT